MNEELYPGADPCLRSGYCCKRVTCAAGRSFGHDGPDLCRFLRGDRPGFYRCGLVEDGLVEPKELAIGAGCSSTMFNEERVKASQNRREHEQRPQ